MSTGQRPRWSLHYPRMRVRGAGRPRRRLYSFTLSAAGATAVWPPTPYRSDDAPHFRRYPHPRSGRTPKETR